MIFSKAITSFLLANLLTVQARLGEDNYSKDNLNLRSLQTCEDYPANWEDHFGDDCGWYEEEGNCEDWGDVDEGTMGFTAVDACCACGGGRLETAPPVPVPPPTSPTPPTPVPPPTPPTPPAPPVNPACPQISAADAAMEVEVVRLVNELRSTGVTCGSRGFYPPTTPIAMDPYLRCSARFHSKWMADNYFSHASPGGAWGESFPERNRSAGFQGFSRGENIAGGQATAQDVVNAWLGSPGHCSGMMRNDRFIGVGFNSPRRYWTQVFGS